MICFLHQVEYSITVHQHHITHPSDDHFLVLDFQNDVGAHIKMATYYQVKGARIDASQSLCCMLSSLLFLLDCCKYLLSIVSEVIQTPVILENLLRLRLMHLLNVLEDCAAIQLHDHFVPFDFKSSIAANSMRGSPAKIPIGAGPSNIREPVLVAQIASGSVAAALNAP